ncbi:MAG: nucleotidyltransferase domain-containing protein [Anaerolineae bacterium]
MPGRRSDDLPFLFLDLERSVQTIDLDDRFLRDVVAVFKEHLGPDLIALVLYGSWARGETRPGSDVDLLLIARHLPSNRFERAAYVHSPVTGQFERRISVLAKEPAEFEGHFPSLYLDIGLDGVILYDSDEYMVSKLARIREIDESSGLSSAVPFSSSGDARARRPGRKVIGGSKGLAGQRPPTR